MIYAVITMGLLTHMGSRDCLLGPNPTVEAIDRFSSEKLVTSQTSPTFLAHAQNDEYVVPANSQMFYEALQAHHVASEYLQLPRGNHGLDVYRGPMWETWQTQSLRWLAEQNMISFDYRATSTQEKR